MGYQAGKATISPSCRTSRPDQSSPPRANALNDPPRFSHDHWTLVARTTSTEESNRRATALPTCARPLRRCHSRSRHNWGFLVAAGVYRVLAALEDAGATRRGYFVEGLGAAPSHAWSRRPAACAGESASLTHRDHPHVSYSPRRDPANPHGARPAVPPGSDEDAPAHRPSRKAGAVVVLVDGDLVLYVEARRQRRSGVLVRSGTPRRSL